jgi:putative ABC transport system substrate-binding protein
MSDMAQDIFGPASPKPGDMALQQASRPASPDSKLRVFISYSREDFAAIQAAGSVGMELSAINLRDAGEIERAIADFAQRPNGGLIVTASQFGTNHPGSLVALAALHKLPAVYPFRYFVGAGGLISYGWDQLNEYHRAAAYVARILKGEKPADLPVQAPTKYELVLNLRTAKALGLEVPPTLLARADEVIE